MKSTARRVLCYGLLTGLVFWRAGPAVAVETATVNFRRRLRSFATLP